jgi:hypothetical protein
VVGAAFLILVTGSVIIIKAAYRLFCNLVVLQVTNRFLNKDLSAFMDTAPLEKLQFQVRLLARTINPDDFPTESLVLRLD